MVRKVINDRHAAFTAAHLRAPSHTLECGQSFADCFPIHAPGFGGNDYSKAVSDIELPDKFHLKGVPLNTFAKNTETRHLARIVNVARLPARIVTGAKCLQSRVKPGPHIGDKLAHGHAVPTGDQFTVG